MHSLDGRLTDDGDVASVTLRDAALLRDAITETGARLLIVDVMMAYVPSGCDPYKDQHMRAILTPLARLAAETSCTVILIRIPRRGSRQKRSMPVVGPSGSSVPPVWAFSR